MYYIFLKASLFYVTEIFPDATLIYKEIPNYKQKKRKYEKAQHVSLSFGAGGNYRSRDDRDGSSRENPSDELKTQIRSKLAAEFEKQNSMKDQLIELKLGLPST